MATKLTTPAVLKYAPKRQRREIGDTTPALVLVIQPTGTKSGRCGSAAPMAARPS